MTNLCIKTYFKAKNFAYDLTHKENGDTNIIAIILVLAIVIVLAVIFRKNIAKLFNSIWESISNNLNSGTQTGPKLNGKESMNEVGSVRLFFS